MRKTLKMYLTPGSVPTEGVPWWADKNAGYTIIGTSDGDFWSGGSGPSRVFGGDGDDNLMGGSGDDVLKGGRGDDFINGGSGDDQIKGGRGDDNLNGGEGDDILLGGKGNDDMDGGPGDDILYAKHGFNELRGGKGADTFVFRKLDSGDKIYGGRMRDFGEKKGEKLYGGLIRDFEDGEDKIVIEGDIQFEDLTIKHITITDDEGEVSPYDVVGPKKAVIRGPDDSDLFILITGVWPEHLTESDFDFIG